MRRSILLRGLLVLLSVCLTLEDAGCSSSYSTERTAMIRATCHETLDDCREVGLSEVWVRDYENGRLVDEYFQLQIEVCPRDDLRFERSLKKAKPRREALGEFDLHDLEVRADGSRSKVWFVERDTDRIIATLDRETGRTTGPDDEPPTWATPDGGERLGAHSD